MKCAIVGCEKEAIIRDAEEEFLQCCIDHVEGVKEEFRERHAKDQQEQYDDWVRSQI